MKKLSEKKTWWWIPQNRTRLHKWTKAIMVGRRCSVRFDRSIDTAYFDPVGMVIAANPEAFDGKSAQSQIKLTQALFAHEVGHLHFTRKMPFDEKLLCLLTNYLEDQRIEMQMSEVFPGIAKLFWGLADLMYAGMKSLDPDANHKVAALAMCLAWRWGYHRDDEEDTIRRVGVETHELMELWSKIRPIVEASWWADTTTEVIEYAKEILEIIDFEKEEEPEEGDMMKGTPDGSDVTGPAGEPDVSDDDAEKSAEAVKHKMSKEATPGTGKIDVYTESFEADHITYPEEYYELEMRAEPEARRLERAMRPEADDVRWSSHEYVGRYDYRLEVRNEEEPHKNYDTRDHDPREVGLAICVDRSGSMSSWQERVKMVLMSIFLAAGRLEIPTSVQFFGDSSGRSNPQPLVVSTMTEGVTEKAKGLIAGFGGRTGAEFMWPSLVNAKKHLMSSGKEVMVCMVIHDGEPVYRGAYNDWNKSQEEVRIMERCGIKVIGIYLGNDHYRIDQMKKLFPRLVAATSSNVSEQITKVFANLARRN